MIAAFVTTAVVLLAVPAQGLAGAAWSGDLKRTDRWVLEYQGEPVSHRGTTVEAGVTFDVEASRFTASPVATTTLVGTLSDGRGSTLEVTTPLGDAGDYATFMNWMGQVVAGQVGPFFASGPFELRGTLRPNRRGTKMKVNLVLEYSGAVTDFSPGPIEGTCRLKGVLHPPIPE